MPPALYVIPDHGLGQIHPLAVKRVDTAAVARHLRTSSSEAADFAVTLRRGGGEDSEGGTGYAVWFRDDRIGELAAADADAYPALGTIVDAGCRPLLTARAARDASGTLTLALRLPAPELVLPANAPPAEPWRFLEPGELLTVHYLPGSRFARVSRKVQYLATLGFDAAGEVAVYIDGEKVGYVDAAAGSRLAPSLRSLERWGVVAVARGFHDPSAGTPRLTVTAGPVECVHLAAVCPLQPLDAAGRPRAAVLPGPVGAGMGLEGGVDKQKSPDPGARRRVAVASVAALTLTGAGVAALAGRNRAAHEEAVAIVSSDPVLTSTTAPSPVPFTPEPERFSVEVLPAEAP